MSAFPQKPLPGLTPGALGCLQVLLATPHPPPSSPVSQSQNGRSAPFDKHEKARHPLAKCFSRRTSYNQTFYNGGRSMKIRTMNMRAPVDVCARMHLHNGEIELLLQVQYVSACVSVRVYTHLRACVCTHAYTRAFFCACVCVRVFTVALTFELSQEWGGGQIYR